MDGLVIGLVQCFALIPGVSRSGATISAGLLRDLDRVTATRLVVLPRHPGADRGRRCWRRSAPATTSPPPSAGARPLVGTWSASWSRYASIAWLLRFVAAALDRRLRLVPGDPRRPADRRPTDQRSVGYLTRRCAAAHVMADTSGVPDWASWPAVRQNRWRGEPRRQLAWRSAVVPVPARGRVRVGARGPDPRRRSPRARHRRRWSSGATTATGRCGWSRAAPARARPGWRARWPTGWSRRAGRPAGPAPGMGAYAVTAAARNGRQALVLVDDAETRADLFELVTAVANGGRPLGIRVIIVAREFGTWWSDLLDRFDPGRAAAARRRPHRHGRRHRQRRRRLAGAGPARASATSTRRKGRAVDHAGHRRPGHAGDPAAPGRARGRALHPGRPARTGRGTGGPAGPVRGGGVLGADRRPR